jgi:hypothetical protein
VSVLTCGTGNESYSFWAYCNCNTDPDNFIDVVFNYGAFDFNTKFCAKFAKGDLEYFAHSYTDFINEYNYEKRSLARRITY